MWHSIQEIVYKGIQTKRENFTYYYTIIQI